MALNIPLPVAMGKAVRVALVTSDHTAAEAAGELGIAHNSFSRRMNGHISFDWIELYKLAHLTGTTLSDLVAQAERFAGLPTKDDVA